MCTNFGQRFFIDSLGWIYCFFLGLDLWVWSVVKMCGSVGDRLVGVDRFLSIVKLVVYRFNLDTL